jgi:acetyl esterase/lipase
LKACSPIGRAPTCSRRTKTVPALRSAVAKAHELFDDDPPPGRGAGGYRSWTVRPDRFRSAPTFPYGLEAPGPALVFFHGGGFVIGTLNTYDAICQRLGRGVGRAR